MLDFIPMMKTDITIEFKGRMLIIDAKFYNKILRDNYLNKTISSNNLYQIMAYVDNQDPYKEGKVSGMLLYAQTINEPFIEIKQKLNMHTIMVRTLDLNESWEDIRNRLNNIAINFKNNTL